MRYLFWAGGWRKKGIALVAFLIDTTVLRVGVYEERGHGKRCTTHTIL